MAWTAPRTWVALEVVTAALLNTHLRDNLLALQDRVQVVRKSADETVTSSTALQNDDELLFAAVAGSSYRFTINLIVSCASGTPDLKVLMTAPAGSLAWGVIGLDTAATSGTASAVMIGRSVATSGSSVSVGAVNGILHVQITGSFLCTTGGNVRLQWAQDTSSVSGVSVMAGSSLEAIRVAA